VTFDVFIEHGGECEARAVDFALREMLTLLGHATVADGHGAIMSGSVSEVAAMADMPAPNRSAN
jgi:hypothetical protein